MGQRYLMDSNVIIDLLANKLPDSSMEFVKKLPILISVVTRMELTGRYNAPAAYVQGMKSLLGEATVLDLEEQIILETIHIRQKNKIKLPDAIIAATALVNKLTLITHDTRDYKGIKNLKVLDSWGI